MSAEIGAMVLILGSIDLYGEDRSCGCRGKTPGSVARDAATEGRTVQAAACRAAVYGFDSHPRLQTNRSCFFEAFPFDGRGGENRPFSVRRTGQV